MGFFTSIYAADLPHRAKAVYMYLRDRANKDGECLREILKFISRHLKTRKSKFFRQGGSAPRRGPWNGS